VDARVETQCNPKWFDRDRFILSAGHGSMLLYALLHLCGYDLSLDESKRFRQLHSKTPGHPEVGLTAGVETTTGPLGQGTANAVGMELAEKFAPASQLARGGYVLSDFPNLPNTPRVILIATGSEVQLAMQAQTELMKQDIAARVVNLPS